MEYESRENGEDNKREYYYDSKYLVFDW